MTRNRTLTLALAVLGPLAVAAGCDRTLVIWSRAAPPPPLVDVELIENEEWDEGIASSIRKGVAAAGQARVLITLTDQPLITAEHLRRLVASPADIAATGYRGIAGVPAAFAPTLRNDLLALRGDRGARAVIEAHDADVIPFEPAGIDIDTEEDYVRL